MENQFEHNPEEQAGWGAYVTPPAFSGLPNGTYRGANANSVLCQSVRERLPHLLEEDGDVRPEMAMSIQAHLAVCPDCTRERDEMQQIVQLMAALPPIEMPLDYAPLIMRRIQTEGLQFQALSQAQSAVKSGVGSDVSEKDTLRSRPQVATTRRQKLRQVQQQAQTQVAWTRSDSLSVWQRYTLAGMLSALLTFVVSGAWGRSLLGSNFAAVANGLHSAAEMSERVPLFAKLMGVIVAGLMQAGGAFAATFRAIGSYVWLGLLMDAALCGVGYYALVTRRSPASLRA